jgi:hypothetical protein
MVPAPWLVGSTPPAVGCAPPMQAGPNLKDGTVLDTAEVKLFTKHPELAPTRFMALVRRPKRRGATDAAVSAATWENGFIAKARVARGSLSPPYTVREIVAELLAHPAARFLRELSLGPLHPTTAAPPSTIPRSSPRSFAPARARCAASRWLTCHRTRPSWLTTASVVALPPDSPELAYAGLGDLSPLYAHLPYLEELRLAGRSMTLGKLALPALKRLRIAVSAPEAFSAIARAKWPALEELHFECGDASIEPMTFAALVALDAPRLASLTLARTGNTDALVVEFARSKVLSRLRALSLAEGRLTDAGAAKLSEALTRGEKRLAALDVSGNTLTKKGAEQLAGVCAQAILEPQRPAAGLQLTDRELADFAPDAAALAKGRALAKPKHWPKLGRDGGLYWGICQGSDKYEVFLRLPDLEEGCTCPSGKRPCKHAIALTVLVSAGHSFTEAAVPKGLITRASEARYSSSWE